MDDNQASYKMTASSSDMELPARSGDAAMRDGGHRPVAATAIPSPTITTFPTQLHYLLTDLEMNGQSDIASFQPHGRAFKIHKLDVFVSTVLPNWFRQSKYTSFQRQLNIYGFKRITAGLDKRAYYHEHFLRGRPELVSRIPRLSLKGQGPRGRDSPSSEPNFYAMPDLPGQSQSSLSAPGQAANGAGSAAPYQGAGTHTTSPSVYLALQRQSRHETGLDVHFGSFPSISQMDGVNSIHSNAVAQVDPGQRHMHASLFPFHFNGSAAISGEGQQRNNAHHHNFEMLMNRTHASAGSDCDRQVQPGLLQALLERTPTQQSFPLPVDAVDRRMNHGNREVSSLLDRYLEQHQQPAPSLSFNTIGHAVQRQGLSSEQQLGNIAPVEQSMSGTWNGMQKVPCTAQRPTSLETLDRRDTSASKPGAISVDSEAARESEKKDVNAGMKRLVLDVLRKHELLQEKRSSHDSSH